MISLYGILMQVSLVHMSYDKHLYFSYLYHLYLNLLEQLQTLIKKKKYNIN